MFFPSRTALTAIILIASAAVAHAQTQEQDHTAHHPAEQAAQPAEPTPPAPPGIPKPGMPMPGMTEQGPAGGMPMVGNMRPMMEMMRMMQASMGPGGGPGGMMPFAHIEGQIAFYKAELKITDAQLPQWNAFAEALRAGAKAMQAAHAQATQGGGEASAVAQMDRRIQMLSAALDAMKQADAAAKPLYEVLSEEQKKAADELMAEHLRRM